MQVTKYLQNLLGHASKHDLTSCISQHIVAAYLFNFFSLHVFPVLYHFVNNVARKVSKELHGRVLLESVQHFSLHTMLNFAASQHEVKHLKRIIKNYRRGNILISNHCVC